MTPSPYGRTRASSCATGVGCGAVRHCWQLARQSPTGEGLPLNPLLSGRVLRSGAGPALLWPPIDNPVWPDECANARPARSAEGSCPRSRALQAAAIRARHAPGRPPSLRPSTRRELAAEAPTTPGTAALHAVADQLAHVIATGDTDRTKVLLRILIAGLHVDNRREVLPTYRVGAPGGFAHRQVQWARQDSNLRPSDYESPALTS